MNDMITTISNLEYTNIADMILVGMMVVGAIYQTGIRVLLGKFEILIYHFVPAFATYVSSLITGVVTALLALYFDMYYSLALLAIVYLMEVGFMMWDKKAGRWFSFTPKEQLNILRHPKQSGWVMLERKEKLGLI